MAAPGNGSPPRIVTFPRSGRIRPRKQYLAVDLPAPLSPHHPSRVLPPADMPGLGVGDAHAVRGVQKIPPGARK